MSTIKLELAPDTEQKLRERAAKAGITLPVLLQQLADKEASEFEQQYLPTGEPKFITRPNLTPEEFRQKLEELASVSTGTVLPPGFSREDIYYDHD
jgi:hypothetical protein